MSKNKPAALLVCSALFSLAAGATSAMSDADGKWQKYSQELNGDLYFYDPSRVNRTGNLQKVWSRIRYKTSVMGASSYQSLLEIDCSEGTERIVQNTFFSDRHWKNPAMNTDMMAKPKRAIVKDSATARLSEILCKQ